MNWSYWSSIHFFGRAQVGPKKISIDETGELWTKVWGLWTFGVRCDPAEVLARDNPIFGIVSFHPLAYVVFFLGLQFMGVPQLFVGKLQAHKVPRSVMPCFSHFHPPWQEGSDTNLFYVDIANVHGVAARRRFPVSPLGRSHGRWINLAGFPEEQPGFIENGRGGSKIDH
jgi:hypothetical protein